MYMYIPYISPKVNVPNQQRTLNKLPTELRCRNPVDKHRPSMQIGTRHAKARMQRVHIPTELSFCVPSLVVGGWVI